jgi:hypothetical protein
MYPVARCSEFLLLLVFVRIVFMVIMFTFLFGVILGYADNAKIMSKNIAQMFVVRELFIIFA